MVKLRDLSCCLDRINVALQLDVLDRADGCKDCRFELNKLRGLLKMLS